MSEENMNPPAGVQEEEPVQIQQEIQETTQEQTREKIIKLRAYYYYDSRQGNEYSNNIFPVLLPSGATIFIKRRIGSDQVLIPLKCLGNNIFLKIWKDNKENLLYNITTISEPLFTHLYLFKKDTNGGTESVDTENNIITITIYNNKDNIKYKIQINEQFLMDVGSYMKDELALALYHLYISHVI